jgi:8-oxo-dGTP diphosphatase
MNHSFSSRVADHDIAALERQAASDGIQKRVAGAVVVNERGDVLLLRRAADDFMGGLVELPSGNVDAGEDMLTGLVREVSEETGLAVHAIERYLGSFDYLSGSGKKARQFNFRVNPQTPIQITLSGEHTEHFWMDPKTVGTSTLSISAQTRAIIASIL